MRLRDLEGIKDQGRVDAYKADWHLIQPDPDNDLRDLTTAENRAHIEALKDDIEKNGVKYPLEIRKGEGDQIFATDGRCRLVALAELEAEGRDFPPKVKVLPEPDGLNRAARTINIIAAGFFRKNLDKFEIARGIKRALSYEASKQEICDAMHWKSVATVDNYLEGLAMEPEAQRMVNEGEASLTTALQVTREHGAAAAPAILNAAKKKDAERRKPGEKARATPRAVAKVTGKSSKQKQATDNLLDFVSVANKIDDEAKRAGGVDRIDPARLAALAKETVATLARAKGQWVEETTANAGGETEPPKPESDSATAPQEQFPTQVQGGYTAPTGDQPTTLPTTGSGVPAASRTKLNGAKDLIEAIEPLAKAVPDFDPELPDPFVIFISDHGQEINAGQCRAAWKAWNAATGGSSEAEAA